MQSYQIKEFRFSLLGFYWEAVSGFDAESKGEAMRIFAEWIRNRYQDSNSELIDLELEIRGEAFSEFEDKENHIKYKLEELK